MKAGPYLSGWSPWPLHAQAHTSARLQMGSPFQDLGTVCPSEPPLPMRELLQVAPQGSTPPHGSSHSPALSPHGCPLPANPVKTPHASTAALAPTLRGPPPGGALQRPQGPQLHAPVTSWSPQRLRGEPPFSMSNVVTRCRGRSVRVSPEFTCHSPHLQRDSIRRWAFGR